jgi:glycosyltransferase involved in cell wall biosynthesis
MKKKKKVLVDLSILKNVNCGLGQVALNYGRYFQQNYRLKDSAFELYLLVPDKYKDAFGSEVKYIRTWWFYRHFAFIPTLFFDVFHSIHQLSRYNPIGWRTKYILTIHDLNFLYEKKSDSKKRKYLTRIQKKIDRADKIATISSFVKLEVEKYTNLKGKSIQVVYNGVEQLFCNTDNQPEYINSEKPFFFSIGEVKDKKNFHVLLPLMKLLPEYNLYIAGHKGTSYAGSIEEYIKKENINNVFLVGTITNDDRVWLYQHCEAFLFPSLFEGFGLPIIEAMLFGKPVFSSTETSLKEIGGRHVYFWDDFSPVSMFKIIKEGLREFAEDPSQAEKNKQYALSFSYERHMKHYLDIYKSLIR